MDFTLSPETLNYLLNLPIAWIPPVQERLLAFLHDPAFAAMKYLFLLLPIMHVLVGMWTTMFAVYTIPFRAERRHFIVVLLTTWWDTGRTLALYWAGILRAVFLTAGWVWGFLRILLSGLYLAFIELMTLPFSLAKRATQSSMQSSIPWVAVSMTFLWSTMEAVMFSYTLYPTVSDIVADLVGATPPKIIVQFMIGIGVFLLIAGSFACVQVLVESIQQRKWKDIIQMVVVETFVMFVEVVFLYRELVDAITPALAQQSGGNVRIGIVGVLTISTVAWIGIRGMTWFLFGRYGTPVLLSIISGRGIDIDEAALPTTSQTTDTEALVFPWTMEMINHVKAEIGWFQDTGKALMEAYALPILQVIAATINFPMVFFTGRHLFQLPIKTLNSFMETGELLKFVQRHRKGENRGEAQESDDYPAIIENSENAAAASPASTRLTAKSGKAKEPAESQPVSNDVSGD